MTHLIGLPEELLQQIADYLDRRSQKQLALAHTKLWEVATNGLWRDVKLIDTRADHVVPQDDRALFDQHSACPGRDDHDDIPIIRKLLVLASNPRIAAKVRVLTHRCHLPLPAIFQDLPRMCFENHTLSSDWRTISLVLLACQNMTSLRTLRLLNGHFNLVAALLNGFYGPDKTRVPPHLWIESCSLHGFPLRFDRAPEDRENGLQSLRLRRLKLANTFDTEEASIWHSRCGQLTAMHYGSGSIYTAMMETAERNTGLRHKFTDHVDPEVMDNLPECVKWLNTKTYDKIPEADIFLKTQNVPCPIYGNIPSLRQQVLQSDNTIGVITHWNASTLRSITLDWILSDFGEDGEWMQYQHLEHLSQLHFPHLRALQLRNAVTKKTLLADHIYLLQPFTYVTPRWPRVSNWGRTIESVPLPCYRVDMLSFMERHPNLECLAWPMDRFYAAPVRGEEDKSIRDRAANVVANLGRTLTSLRVDHFYTPEGEAQSDEDMRPGPRAARIRRRLFISDFAAHMTKLTVLKLEGGIPRDEKREMMAATARCALEKVVMIAVSCPLGNTWGPNGEDLSQIDEGHLQINGLLEAEAEEALVESTKEHYFPGNAPSRVPFRATYGWPAGPSLMHSIALHHASTITELKFCGYHGSPILHQPTPITKAILHHLRHFHNLKKIVMSFWLLTFFDFDWREPEIIDYWMEQRDPSSTSLVPVPQAATAGDTAPAGPPTWQSMVAANTGTVNHENTGTGNHENFLFNTIMAPAANNLSLSTLLADHEVVNTELSAALADTEMEGMQPSDNEQHDVGSHHSAMAVQALAPLSANIDTDAPTVFDPDAMMAAALGAGMIGASEDEITVIPLTNQSSAPIDIPTPSPSNIQHDFAEFPSTFDWMNIAQEPFVPPIYQQPLPTDEELNAEVAEDESWETMLRERYSPLALAKGVNDILGPHLSHMARKRGVNMRASFCLGVESGDIFDLDFKVDERRGGVVEESLVGPREESESGRWWRKLEERAWFG